MDHTTYLPIIMGPTTKEHHSKAADFYNLLLHDPRQQRRELIWSDSLAHAAQSRCKSLVKFDYWAHCDPSGKCPNVVAREYGFILPSYYGDGNNIESLGGGTINARIMFNALANSPAHSEHILGLTDFFREQNRIGISAFEAVGSRYTFYYCVLIAKQG